MYGIFSSVDDITCIFLIPNLMVYGDIVAHMECCLLENALQLFRL